MLIGLGVVLGMLGIISIAAICCYACGKHYKRQTDSNRADPNATYETPQRYQRIPWRYPKLPRSESSVRQVKIEYANQSSF